MQEPSFVSALVNDGIADVAAFRDCSIQHADPAKRIRRKVVVPAATQQLSRERTFTSPPTGQIYTGRLSQSHDPSGSRTKRSLGR